MNFTNKNEEFSLSPADNKACVACCLNNHKIKAAIDNIQESRKSRIVEIQQMVNNRW